MINLKIGTNTQRKEVIVMPNQTVQSVLDEYEINTVNSALHINGTLIAHADTDQTFEELGVKDGTKAMLIAVVKADSAR